MMAVDLSARRDCDSADWINEDRDTPSPLGHMPDSPRPHDTSIGSLSADNDDLPNRSSTPSSGRRKNKRKMSEPRRLSDFAEKRPRVEEVDSGVESTSAPDSADRSPVDEVDSARVPGMYPPTVMLPAYLPYPYTFINPAMTSLQSLQMMNSGQLPVNSGASVSTGHSTPVQGRPSSRASRKSRTKPRDRDRSPSPESLLDPELGECSSPKHGDMLLDDDARRQYKTMSVERRVEANARERTRVHTISAAFEALRRAVPAYSYNQKLSKLAILRIACCYILSLSRLADKDYSRDQSRPSFRECVELTTRTIQAEGRAKKRH